MTGFIPGSGFARSVLAPSAKPNARRSRLLRREAELLRRCACVRRLSNGRAISDVMIGRDQMNKRFANVALLIFLVAPGSGFGAESKKKEEAVASIEKHRAELINLSD